MKMTMKVIRLSSEEKNRVEKAIEQRYGSKNRISDGLAIAELCEQAVGSHE